MRLYLENLSDWMKQSMPQEPVTYITVWFEPL